MNHLPRPINVFNQNTVSLITNVCLLHLVSLTSFERHLLSDHSAFLITLDYSVYFTISLFSSNEKIQFSTSTSPEIP